jgi:hypothetical protein
MNYPPKNQGRQNGFMAAVNNVANAAVNNAAAVVNNAAAVVNNAAAAVANTTSGAVEAVTNVAQNAAQNIGNGLNKTVNAMPAAINSLIPFTNNVAGKNGQTNENTGNGLIGDMVNQALNGNANKKNNNGSNAGSNTGSNNAFLNAVNSALNANSSGGEGGFFQGTLGIFIALFTLFLIIFAVFNEQIREGYEYAIVSLKKMLGLDVRPDVVSQITPAEGDIKSLTHTPPTMDESTTAPYGGQTQAEKIMEKILPTPGGSEVFNVAQNKFTYYDAEPLCKALGAELATYDQVRDAWAKGADWCNYGWVKGQMAIYPTQRETYDKLQNGPPEEKRACGTTGVNGGVFDNPELRFGVNCYGQKPSQTNHDEKSLMEQGKVPRGPETLAVDRKIADFKEEADSLFIRPFNSGKWHS